MRMAELEVCGQRVGLAGCLSCGIQVFPAIWHVKNNGTQVCLTQQLS